MSFIKLIILLLLAYFAIKFVNYILRAPAPKSEIKGSPKTKKPLDLSNADIEDADFKEINDH